MDIEIEAHPEAGAWFITNRELFDVNITRKSTNVFKYIVPSQSSLILFEPISFEDFIFERSKERISMYDNDSTN